MTRGALSTYFRLSPSDRRLAQKTVALAVFVRLGLWLIPFRRVQRVCDRLSRTTWHHRAETGTREIVWAVRLASRYVPRATCLVQALTAQVLLGRNGHHANLHIGVARDDRAGFRAHAWVESQGKVLVGGSEHDYTSILVLDGEAANR